MGEEQILECMECGSTEIHFTLCDDTMMIGFCLEHVDSFVRTFIMTMKVNPLQSMYVDIEVGNIHRRNEEGAWHGEDETDSYYNTMMLKYARANEYGHKVGEFHDV